MITSSGIHIQKIGQAGQGTPTPADIAVHAGRICRFGGAVWYPLLPHLIFVGLLAYKRSRSLVNFGWGLLHDAHEIATSDVPRPFKCDCMRAEQKAIDERLLAQFFTPEQIAEIDFDLIKQCDIDAVHIEGVTLEVPGFAETEMKFAADYTGQAKIYDDLADIKLFRRIRASKFGSVYGETTNAFSSGVMSFQFVLTSMMLKKDDVVQNWVNQW